MNIIVKNIPNTITSLNLLSGIAGILCAFSGRLDVSFLLMLAAAVFDFFDGFAARALGAYSPMGKELDSLADSVSFGLLPSLMLHRLMVVLSGETSVWCYIPLSIALFSVLRLAKFNIDERQSENFIGLATPASAMICGSLTYYLLHQTDSYMVAWAQGHVFIQFKVCRIVADGDVGSRCVSGKCSCRRYAKQAVLVVRLLQIYGQFTSGCQAAHLYREACGVFCQVNLAGQIGGEVGLVGILKLGARVLHLVRAGGASQQEAHSCKCSK